MRSLRDATPALAPTAFAAAALLGYVAVSGLRSTVLKGLQTFGAGHPIGGENPISFCNVFFISQLMVGLALCWPSRPGWATTSAGWMGEAAG